MLPVCCVPANAYNTGFGCTAARIVRLELQAWTFKTVHLNLQCAGVIITLFMGMVCSRSTVDRDVLSTYMPMMF